MDNQWIAESYMDNHLIGEGYMDNQLVAERCMDNQLIAERYMDNQWIAERYMDDHLIAERYMVLSNNWVTFAGCQTSMFLLQNDSVGVDGDSHVDAWFLCCFYR